jgi:hypothetical protein
MAEGIEQGPLTVCRFFTLKLFDMIVAVKNSHRRQSFITYPINSRDSAKN